MQRSNVLPHLSQAKSTTMKTIKSFFITAVFLLAVHSAGAQSVKNNADPVYKDQAPTHRHERVYDHKDIYKDSDDNYPNDHTYNKRRVDESLNRAAEAASRAAEKLQVVIEDKAQRIARESQPAIENFLIATSNLIEKLATEISRAVDEKSSRP